MPDDNTFRSHPFQRVSAAPSIMATLLVMLLPGGGCAPTAAVRGGSPAIEEAQFLPYDGPKARIAVARFEDRTAKGYDRIGGGMSTMFITALVNSNRFIVLERDIIDEIIGEQDLATAGRVSPETGVPTGEIEGAELLLTGAVTEFEPRKFGIGSGIIGLGTLIGSALLHERERSVPVGAATYMESHIAIDVRLIDTATSRVLADVSIEGNGQDWGGFVAGEVGGGKSRLPLGFGGFQNAATEKAVRAAIDLAVVAIASQTPHSYNRHRDDQYAGGRIAGFSYLNLQAADTSSFPVAGVTVAGDPEEWSSLASSLGREDRVESPPVDFQSQRVVAVAAGTQVVSGRSIAVEKAVQYPDRIEITASLHNPPPEEDGPKDGGKEAAGRQPVILLAMERLDLPVTLIWKESPI